MSRPTYGRPRDDVDIGVLLTVALDAFKARLHAHLAATGYDDLGGSFGFVFRSLAEQPLSLSELASCLGITAQGALKIVAEMEKKGYVASDQDKVDRRIRRLSLTVRGRAALREARRFHGIAEKELARSVGQRKVASARAVLSELAASSPTDGTNWADASRPF